MNLNKLYKVLEGQPKYRIQQAKDAIFKKLASNWSEASNISKDFKEKLNKECPLEIDGQIFASRDAKTTKALITLADGLQIETVMLSHKDGRHTVCVSTQVGCSLACTFCATGKMGLKRNLEVEEMLQQVLFFSRILKEEDKRVSNVVVMGMGEPFLNYDNTIKAIKYLNEDLGIGARHISISTSGVLNGIDKLANEKMQVNLAISLHAPNDRLRNELMPINKRFPMKDLFKAVDKYIIKTGRRVMFEYLMIKGINDSPEQAKELAELMKKPLYMVNLIAYNPTDVYKASDKNAIEDFRKVLEQEGVGVTQRYSFGQDIDAACGQLANKKNCK
ncbi:23S rRNA (adenine(2503)-C(2))-methyltransferase RlmN [Candidatus Parcubacteria bacterium]|jgi:23S rRNA (adenine2503-C2)-methyltransferase|nr:23S rRNA (adenine(2503)-C(2))-methyltransferase RlmN [Candidatus Parcubacteria bacterium]